MASRLPERAELGLISTVKTTRRLIVSIGIMPAAAGKHRMCIENIVRWAGRPKC